MCNSKVRYDFGQETGTLHKRVANISLAAAYVAVVVVSHSPRFEGNTHNAGVATYLGFRTDVRC